MKSAVVCCVTSNWLPAAAVTLLTACKAGKAPSEFVICTTPPSDADRASLRRFSERHGIALKVVTVDPLGLERSDLDRFGVGSLIRLTLDRHLDATFDRILYLDADVLVSNDIRNLLASPLFGKTLGAVPDIGILSDIRPKVARHRASLGLRDGELYFNSGVLLFDWQQCLARRALARARDMLASRPHWISPDQDALNLALRAEWQPLDYCWNATGIVLNYTDFKPAISHFTASEKPWSARRHLWHDRWHRQYTAMLADTGWESFVEARTPYTFWRAAGEAVRQKFAARQRAGILRVTGPGLP